MSTIKKIFNDACAVLRRIDWRPSGFSFDSDKPDWITQISHAQKMKLDALVKVWKTNKNSSTEVQ